MTHEEFFNHCLSELESPYTIDVSPLTGARSPKAIPHSIFNLTQPPTDTILLAQICINCSRFDVIKVMKSGIFHRGGLKGAPLAKGKSNYKVYYFNDLIYSILLTTSYLVSEKPSEHLRYYNSAFERAINQIDGLKLIASYYDSKRNMNSLDLIKKYIENIKSNLLKKPDIALPPRSKEKGDCVDLLISLFMRRLPMGTPDNVMSKAIAVLLELFKIYFIGEAGIRQRITRLKQK